MNLSDLHSAYKVISALVPIDDLGRVFVAHNCTALPQRALERGAKPAARCLSANSVRECRVPIAKSARPGARFTICALSIGGLFVRCRAPTRSNLFFCCTPVALLLTAGPVKHLVSRQSIAQRPSAHVLLRYSPFHSIGYQ